MKEHKIDEEPKNKARIVPTDHDSTTAEGLGKISNGNQC